MKQGLIKIGRIESFSKELEQLANNKKTFILCDSNTKQCVNYFKSKIPFFSTSFVIEIEPGEKNKTLKSANSIWEELIDKKANRADLLINIGGGLITDLGGFVASTFKRGISFINIPTSLLGMIDASIGGKTGVNCLNFKNQIGTFYLPEITICDPEFLATLGDQELLSGYAEAIKHGLVYDEKYWEFCTAKSLKKIDLTTVISKSIELKSKIVEIDPFEKNERKLLNFGHTIGHALEAINLSKTPILHGFAVANGMRIEAFIAKKLSLLSPADYTTIDKVISDYFPIISYEDQDIKPLIVQMLNDKKNSSSKINFTLINKIGNGIFDQHIETTLIEQILLDFNKEN